MQQQPKLRPQGKDQPAPVYVLVWNPDLKQWEIWEERVLWRLLQRCRRQNTGWGDIE